MDKRRKWLNSRKAEIPPNQDTEVDVILLQFIAEYHQGLNELAGHGTAVEQAKTALNLYYKSILEDIIGADELPKAKDSFDYEQAVEDIYRRERNTLRAAQRQRLESRLG